MSVRIIHGSALELPLDDDSVDLVVTSPPYFSLRSYTEDGAALEHQVGGEATPAEYVDALLAATAEMVRVLKPSGSLWVNLGDKYNSAASGQNGKGGGLDNAATYERMTRRGSTVGSVPTKSLMGLPWRYALACIDQLGLILRAEIIWDKPNGLPESVRDRVRRSHEQWFHFTLSPRYYANMDEVREPHKYPDDDRSKRASNYAPTMTGNMNGAPNPLGKLPGSVWRIATQPLRVPAELGVDHFAAFPMEGPRRIITGWSPPGICTACGEGRRAVVTAAEFTARGFAADQQDSGRGWHGGDPARRALGIPAAERQRTITGYACACPTPDAPTRPAVVLDPFGGTGTTALVADVLGRDGISVDLSADYCRLATWRTADPAQRARVLKNVRTP